MGTTLTGQTQSSTYDALLKITDNGPVGGSLKVVTDGLGNDSALQISTAGIASSGTFTAIGSSTLAALNAQATTVTTLTGTGILKTSSVAADAINVDAAAATIRAFAVKTANVLRWNWGATSTAEAGSNAGSDFFLAAYTDAGALINTPIIITRATGKAGLIGLENTPIGAATPSSGAFTNLSASGTLAVTGVATFTGIPTGVGLTALFASPPAIGGTAAAAGSFTTVAASSTVTDAQGDVRLITQNIQSGPYTLVIGDKGKAIHHPSADTTARTWTIPANSSVAFPLMTPVTFTNENAAGVITIAITTDTMRLAGAGTTGNRTLAANGIATAVKVTATSWLISGTGLT